MSCYPAQNLFLYRQIRWPGCRSCPHFLASAALKKKLCELGWAVDESLRLLSIVFHKGSSIGRFGSRYFPICHLGKLPFARAP